MALDKQFLKYKLEKIKNDRIFKDQDTETKRRIRKENAKLAQEEADAIHSYLTGEDPIDSLDNKSFLENKSPGSLYLNRKNILDIRTVTDDLKSKKRSIRNILKRYKTISNANLESGKRLQIFKRIFNSLQVKFGLNSLSIGANLKVENDEIVGGNLKVEGNSEVIENLKVDGMGTINGDLFLKNFRLDQNGYTYLPNGIILQWGSDSRNSDDAYTLDFPISFPNNCFSVVINRQKAGAGSPMCAINITKTGFTINRDDSIDDSQTINYMAIGH